MADISFDSASSGTTNSAGTFSFNHSAASDSFMYACSSEDVTGITFNGVSLTLSRTYTPVTPPGTNCPPLKVWELQNPSVGTYPVFVTASDAAVVCVGTWLNSNEVPQDAVSEENSSNNQVTSFAPSVTTVKDRSWVITFAINPSGVSRKLVAGSSTALRVNNWGGLFTQGLAILDSNAVVTPAASRTINIDIQNSSSSPASDFITTVTLSIKTPTTISVSDAISLSESTNLEHVKDLSVSDSITVTESVALEKTVDIMATDVVGITESLSITNDNLGGISISDSISVQEFVDGDYYPSLVSGLQEMDSREDGFPLGMDDETML